jgi:hypothetical protein
MTTTVVELAQVVQRLRDLPALPSIVLDLISSFGREDVDVTTLAEKMSRDQAMAAKILRLANSSFYGLPAKVKTVKQAIVVLGFDSARALAVASNVIDRSTWPTSGAIRSRPRCAPGVSRATRGSTRMPPSSAGCCTTSAGSCWRSAFPSSMRE